MKRIRMTALFAALCLCLALAGCSGGARGNEAAQAPVPQSGEQTAIQGTNPAISAESRHFLEQAPLGEITLAASYDEIRQALAANFETRNAYGAGRLSSGTIYAEADAAAPEAAGSGAGDPGYGTNVQVAGVDELDALKTDGTYLYLMTDDGFSILQAAGAETRVLSHTVLAADNEDAYVSPMGLFVSGERVGLLYEYSYWGTDEDGSWFDENRTGLAIYDTAQKNAPELCSDVRQDGYYCAARMLNGRILLVTNDYVGYSTVDDENWDCIPSFVQNGEKTLLDADRIYICPQTERAGFTFVSVFALSDGQTLDSLAFTDTSDVVYMDGDALYLGRTVAAQTASEPYPENQYTVTDYVQQATTEIKRIDLAADAIAMTASAEVPGSLLNQFSMDVYDGCLRLATTTSVERYSLYSDEAYGWENYRWYDSERNNRVTVLDAELKQIGVLEDMVADEQIYSVRFIGTMGYVVTFEQVDPVFTVDLSDPTAPKLESALEVPGVSRYLHPYTQGLLLGFGQAVNENSATEEVLLSMFDVSDPKTVRMTAQTVTDYDYSEALYDHHAIYVSPEQNLIGFAGHRYDEDDTEFALYRYDGDVFSKIGSYTMPMSAYNLRTVCIDGYLYLCGRYAVNVVALDGLQSVAYLSEAVG